MAQNKILISACLFFVLIFTQETRFIEGMRLLVGKNNEFQMLQTHNKIHEKEINKHRGKFHDDHRDMTATSDAITHEAILLSPPTAAADEGVAPPPPSPAHAMITDFRPTTEGPSPPGSGHHP